jgi:hypothetical protein
MPFAMLDLGMQLLKLLAVIGGATVGGLVSGWLFRLVVRLAFRRQVPRPALLLIQFLGAVTLGLAVWYWVVGSGGWGPGGGGLLGRGGTPGTVGEAKGTGEAPKQKPADETAKAKGVAPKAGPEVLRIEMLGGQRVKDHRFYLAEGQPAPQTLAELRQAVAERQKQASPLKGIEIIIYEDSVARDHPAVRDLEKWARENELAVTVTFPKREMP